jgi:hypothetical protein
LLVHVDVARGPERLGLVEAGDKEMDLVGPALALEADG